MPRESGHISYQHIKSNIIDELTITGTYFTSGGQEDCYKLNSSLALHCFMQQHLNTFHTFIHYLYTYICIVAKCSKRFINTPCRSKQLTSINHITRHRYCTELLFILETQFNIIYLYMSGSMKTVLKFSTPITLISP